LSNVRFCYAQEAMRLEGSYVSGTLSHAQLIHCVRGIVLMNADDGSGSGSGSAGWDLSHGEQRVAGLCAVRI